jgi:hypothetical protein
VATEALPTSADFLQDLQRSADASPHTGRLFTLQAQAKSSPVPSAPVQLRQHADRALKDFLDEHQKNKGEEHGKFVNRVTGEFKSNYPQHDRADLDHLRRIAWKSEGKGMKAYPSVTPKTLAGSFDAHVKGDQKGVGWHTEMSHARDGANYKYQNAAPISSTKGTYYAENVTIKGTLKSGNEHRSTFFPAGMSMDDIRYEAVYVANSFPKSGLVATGRGPRTGIMIDTLLNDNTIDSAYPHKPGW